MIIHQEVRDEIEALRVMNVSEYMEAMRKLRAKLKEHDALEKYAKHLADVEHQMQKKINRYVDSRCYSELQKAGLHDNDL
jgi:hypothetical protein